MPLFQIIGVEQTIFKQIAELEFGVASKTAILSFIMAAGITKAIANYFTGRLANKFGCKNLLLFVWRKAIQIPFIFIYTSSVRVVLLSTLFLISCALIKT
jgi:predicted MFS family arabinose efflux permease